MEDFLIFISLCQLCTGFSDLHQHPSASVSGTCRTTSTWCLRLNDILQDHITLPSFFSILACISCNWGFKEIGPSISPWLSCFSGWRTFYFVHCTFLVEKVPDTLLRIFVHDIHSSIQQCLLSACLLPGSSPVAGHTMWTRSLPSWSCSLQKDSDST